MVFPTENTTIRPPAPRGAPSVSQGALKSLAIVGFIALIVTGILLAIYASRFVPKVVEGIGSATVSFSQIFTPVERGTLSVVQNIHNNKGIGATATSTVSTKTKTTTPTVTHLKIPATHKITRHTTKKGERTTNVYPINGTYTAPMLHGLPDLVTHISAIGYLTGTSTSSFVAATTTPFGTRVAVKFAITNIGTNIAGPWSFSASLPTQVNYIFNSVTQKKLDPGDHIDYILSFDQANKGTNQTISITVNPKHVVKESDFVNNSAPKSITVLGN